MSFSMLANTTRLQMRKKSRRSESREHKEELQTSTMKAAHANTQEEEESGGLRASGRAHTYRSDDQSPTSSSLFLKGCTLTLIHFALSQRGLKCQMCKQTPYVNKPRTQSSEQADQTRYESTLRQMQRPGKRWRREKQLRKSKEERRERESYLEYNLVVGGGRASHPESKLTGVALNVLRHP